MLSRVVHVDKDEMRVYRSDAPLDKMAHDTKAIAFADTGHKVLLDVGVWLPFDAFLLRCRGARSRSGRSGLQSAT